MLPRLSRWLSGLGQDPGIESLFGALRRGWRFLGSNIAEAGVGQYGDEVLNWQLARRWFTNQWWGG
jgi:hypothetical protein